MSGIRVVLALLLAVPLLARPLLAESPRNEELEDAIESYLRTFHERRAVLGTMLAVAGPSVSAAAFAPTDPTQFARSLAFTLEWVNLVDGAGNIVFVHTTWSQPLGENDQFRVLFDVPLGYAETDTEGDHFGIGDLRLQFAWRPWAASDPSGPVFQAWSAQFDLLCPTGNEGDALGGGDWLLAPAGVFKFRAGKALLYLTTRWICANSVRPAGVRGFNIPGVDGGDNIGVSTRVNELDLELAAAWEFDRSKNAVHWISIGADFAHNFAGDEDSQVLLKTRLGRRIGETLYVDLDLWFAVAGERTADLTFRLAIYWDF